MLTIFSTPKPFTGHNAINQINAIYSWTKLDPKCEVILFGNEEGAREVCSKFGVKYFPDIKRNEHGTPLINSIFNIAEKTAKNELLCYINADIILMKDFLPAIHRIKNSNFLVIGRRWDLSVDKLLDFDNPETELFLHNKLIEFGRLHGASGIDYFVFPRNLYRDVPSFAVGRPGWDNWMIYHARSMKVPVIDATGTITAIHQNHDYSHHPRGEIGVWKGPEAIRNRELAGDGEHALTLEHANWRLTPRGIKQALSPRDLYFRLDAATVLCSPLKFLRKPMKLLTRFLIRIRSVLGIGTE